jgi:hypothetical protein
MHLNLALRILICSSLCLSLGSATAESIRQAIPIGNGKNLVCLTTTENNLYLAKPSSTGFSTVNPSTTFAKAKNALQKLINSGNTSAKTKKKIRLQKSIIKDIKRCNSRELVQDVTNPCRVIGGTVKRAPISNDEVSSRIIYGETCNDSGSPFVQLNVTNNEGTFLCTGSVIGPKTIITAAHCLEGTLQAVCIKNSACASAYRIHPAYNDTPLNDIALLYFDNSIGRRAVGINGTKGFLYYPSWETLIVGGFGKDENGVYQKFKAASMPLYINEDGVLVTYFDPSKNNYGFGNTCFGDSGGPLLARRFGIWTLSGVTSNGTSNTCGVGDTSDFSGFADLTRTDNASFIKQYVTGEKFIN